MTNRGVLQICIEQWTKFQCYRC